MDLLKAELNAKDHQLIVLSCSETDLKEQNKELISRLNALQKSESSEERKKSQRLSTLLSTNKK